MGLLYKKHHVKRYQEGGKFITPLNSSEEKDFKVWYDKTAKFKNLNPDPDADDQKYDYRGYWKNENSSEILKEKSSAHFIDKYKQPGHPTFSNESQYSNKNTQGGSWSQDNNKTWYFTHSPYTSKYAEKTYDYLKGTGEFSILGNDTLR